VKSVHVNWPSNTHFVEGRLVGYTKSSSVLARRAAPVASGVNAPERRPSVSAAASHRRSAQPRSRVMMADADRRTMRTELSSARWLPARA